MRVNKTRTNRREKRQYPKKAPVCLLLSAYSIAPCRVDEARDVASLLLSLQKRIVNMIVLPLLLALLYLPGTGVIAARSVIDRGLRHPSLRWIQEGIEQ